MADLYHTGLVVDDIRSAMSELSGSAGAEWAEPVRASAPVRVSGKTVERESWVTLSCGGPPHIELIEQVSGGIWAPGDGSPRLHHLGFWVDDLATESARLEQSGLPLHLTADGSNPVNSFVYHCSTALGWYVELNLRSKRERIYAWISGDSLAGGVG